MRPVGLTKDTSVRVHQAHLADAAEREAMKAHWGAPLDRLERVLAG